MAYDINALMGQNLTPQETIMADQLRGEQRQGQVLGMSTLAPVAQMGQQQATGAAQAAKQAGGLKLTRDQMTADAERRAADKAENLRRYEKDRAATEAYRGEQRGERADYRNDKADERWVRNSDRALTNVSERMTAAGIPVAKADIEGVNQAIINTRRISGDDSLPTIGGLANIGVLGDIWGHVQGNSELQAALQSLFNSRLKAISGGAVTPSEATRSYMALSRTWLSNEDDFKKALKLYTKTIDAQQANILKGASQQVRYMWDNDVSSLDYLDMQGREGAPPETAAPAAAPAAGTSGGFMEGVDTEALNAIANGAVTPGAPAPGAPTPEAARRSVDPASAALADRAAGAGLARSRAAEEAKRAAATRTTEFANLPTPAYVARAR